MAITIKQDGQSLITGIHHVTTLASDANVSNRFFTRTLGLRRVKQTVNSDAPDIYHLYYGDELGRPGTVMTCFPFPHMPKGSRGTGEASAVVFSVPEGAFPFWKGRLDETGIQNIREYQLFDEKRLVFEGPDGESLMLVENAADKRQPWYGASIAPEMAIRGFHAISLCLAADGRMSELLHYMGYEETDKKDKWRRFQLIGGNGANIIDIEIASGFAPARQGVGSVNHIAFAVENHKAQLVVREALLDAGYNVTPVIDRNYFSSVYFHGVENILFEIATNKPGFIKDEDAAHLGEKLKLPKKHEHMREFLVQQLVPLHD